MKRPSMSGSLYRLIYCSRNTLTQTTTDGMDQELQSILDTARRRNNEDNITGALLLTSTGFAQVLEGPREALERTFERINADPRHSDVIVLSFTPTERRSFADWSMGFSAQIAPNAADPLAHVISDTTSGRPRVTRGSDVLRMLEGVIKRDDSVTTASSPVLATDDIEK